MPKIFLENIPWTERQFEKLVSLNIQDFISSDLMVIFAEETVDEEPDIMAVDSQGDLYIVEIKRREEDQKNLLQVLEYGQMFASSTYEDLDEKFKKYSKYGRDLREVHKEYFELERILDRLDFNKKQHFLIITNGLDQETVNKIVCWRTIGLDIDAIVYWVYEINGECFIEFDMYSPFRKYEFVKETNAFLLNTNFSNDEDCQAAMLKEKKAAAYCDPWKYSITRITKDDLVFLYQSGVGIVAYGKGDGVVHKVKFKFFNTPEDEDEYNMKLNNFVLLKKPMAASEIRQIYKKTIGRNPNYRMTLVEIDSTVAKALQREIDTHYV